MPHQHLNRGAIDRILKIDALLTSRRPINCTQLVKLFRVSRQTILADIAHMRDRQGRPIEFDSLSNTYYYDKPVGPLPPMNVSEGEVFALMIACNALKQYQGTPFHQQLSASFDKLTAGLNSKVSFDPAHSTQSVSFKTLGKAKIDPKIFQIINRGAMRECEVEFDYRKPGDTEKMRRNVQPYHLTYRENLCYMVGFDHERKAIRTFALSRITAPLLTPRKFNVPPDFDPEKYFASALSVFGGDGNHRIVLRFKGASADRIREREWHDTEKRRELPDGRLELEFRLGALPEIERWLLSWGAEVEVVQPKQLRQSVAEIGRQIHVQNRDP